MVSTRTSPGPGGGTVSVRSVAVRRAVNQRALAFSSSPIRDAIRVLDASAEDQVYPIGFHHSVGKGERPGELADTKITDGFYAVTKDLGRDANGEPVDQPGPEEARDQGGTTLDHYRLDAERHQLTQQDRKVHTTVDVGRQIQDGCTQSDGFLATFCGSAVRDCEHCPRGRAVSEHGGVGGRAQGAVYDHAQGALAWNVTNRQAGIVVADRAGADEDGVVTGAHLVGEAQGVRAADPL